MILCCNPSILIYNINLILVSFMITCHNASAYVRRPRPEIDSFMKLLMLRYKLYKSINYLGKPYTRVILSKFKIILNQSDMFVLSSEMTFNLFFSHFCNLYEFIEEKLHGSVHESLISYSIVKLFGIKRNLYMTVQSVRHCLLYSQEGIARLAIQFVTMSYIQGLCFYIMLCC